MKLTKIIGLVFFVCLSLPMIAETKVLIKITPPTDSGGYPVVGYIIQYRGEDRVWKPVVKDVLPPIKEYMVKGLLPGEYYFRAFAVTKMGKGEPSNEGFAELAENGEAEVGLKCGDCFFGRVVKSLKTTDVKSSFADDIFNFVKRTDVKVPYRLEE